MYNISTMWLKNKKVTNIHKEVEMLKTCKTISNKAKQGHAKDKSE